MAKALPVICLAGPTGSGKTEAALKLCLALGGEVINTDSRQVYTHFPIITAQPNCEERALCAHHLYGFLQPDEKLSAGQWASKAREVAHDIALRGKIPIFVGGTGLYFRALLEGIAEIPPVPEHISQSLLKRCELEGSQALHAELMHIDADYALRIHPNDPQRIMRALEVFISTGKPFSWWHKNAMPEPLVKACYLGLQISLEELSPRLYGRIEAMLAAGAIQEAMDALKICAQKNAPAWSGIGCAELYAHLCEELSLEQTIELWRKNTRAYAKRQLTWFRAQKQIQWFLPQDNAGLVAAARNFLDSHNS